MYQNENLVI